MNELILNHNQYLELEKLAWNAFAPLVGFMTEEEFNSVVKTMRLPDGEIFPLPVILSISSETAKRLGSLSHVKLVYAGQDVGTLQPKSVFTCNKQDVAQCVFGT